MSSFIDDMIELVFRLVLRQEFAARRHVGDFCNALDDHSLIRVLGRKPRSSDSVPGCAPYATCCRC